MANRSSPIEKALNNHIGQTIRERRRAIGQSQSELAEAVSRSFQQMQKYERGLNRVPASLLYTIAGAQGVEAAFYFTGFEPPVDTEGREGRAS